MSGHLGPFITDGSLCLDFISMFITNFFLADQQDHSLGEKLCFSNHLEQLATRSVLG